MPYVFDHLFAADEANPQNVARNSSVTIFLPGDATMTPVTGLKTVDGQPYPNPITTNANGYAAQPVHDTLDRLAWASGGGFTGVMTAYEGMKEVAVAAQSAAEAAVAEAAAAGANAAAEAAAALAVAVSDAEAAQAAAESAAALVGAPADTAIAAAVNGSGTATKAALNATYAGGYTVPVSTGGDDAPMLQAAIDAAVAAKQPLSFKGAWYTVSDSLKVPTNAVIHANGTLIQTNAGTNKPVMTNADRINGNSGIVITDLKLDGNAPGQTGQYNTAEFMRVTKSRFSNMSVTGAQRNQMFPNGTNGDGLCLIYCHDNEINGGRFYGNTYDGIKLRSSNRNKIIAPTCEDNGRSGIQLAFYSPTGPPYNVGEGVEAEGSNDNVISGAVITHSTGTPHAAAPTTSGIYLHTANRNTITNFRIEGVQQGIGFYSGNRDNQFATGVIRTRYGSTARASIDLEHGTEYRNTFSNITVRPLSGANGKLLNLVAGGVGNRFLGCRFDLGDGTGTWTLTNAATDTQILDYVSAFPITSTGAGAALRDAAAAASASASQFLRADSFAGASGAVPYGWQTRWNQTGATWTENASGYVQVVKASAGRAALANSVAGDLDDVEVLVKLRTTNHDLAATPIGVIVRGSGAQGAESGYLFALGEEPLGGLYVLRYKAGAALTVRTAAQGVAATWATNTWVWMRVRIVGSGASVAINARLWNDGSTEPTTWNIASSDTTADRVTGSGFHGILGSSTGTHDCDYYEVRKA